jgi:hypothetical protein
MTTWTFDNGDYRFMIQFPDGIELSNLWLQMILMSPLVADGYERV